MTWRAGCPRSQRANFSETRDPRDVCTFTLSENRIERPNCCIDPAPSGEACGVPHKITAKTFRMSPCLSKTKASISFYAMLRFPSSRQRKRGEERNNE